jgi:hypothetical protein
MIAQVRMLRLYLCTTKKDGTGNSCTDASSHTTSIPHHLPPHEDYLPDILSGDENQYNAPEVRNVQVSTTEDGTGHTFTDASSHTTSVPHHLTADEDYLPDIFGGDGNQYNTSEARNVQVSLIGVYVSPHVSNVVYCSDTLLGHL